MTTADFPAPASAAVVTVRPLGAGDEQFAATLHEAALPHGFFGRLGPAFLAAYYETFRTSPYAVALVAETDAGPVGVIVGTFGPHHAWVLRARWATLARRGLLALLVRPAELTLFLRTRLVRYARGLVRFRRRGVDHRNPRPGGPGPAVLTHVAVSDSARGSGAGSVLVAAFEDAVRRRGAREVCLVTLAGPSGAGPFYRRLGWDLTESREDRDGRPVECYRRHL